jgi:hypothetical protein
MTLKINDDNVLQNLVNHLWVECDTKLNIDKISNNEFMINIGIRDLARIHKSIELSIKNKT